MLTLSAETHFDRKIVVCAALWSEKAIRRTYGRGSASARRRYRPDVFEQPLPRAVKKITAPRAMDEAQKQLNEIVNYVSLVYCVNPQLVMTAKDQPSFAMPRCEICYLASLNTPQEPGLPIELLARALGITHGAFNLAVSIFCSIHDVPIPEGANR
ncbi:MAG: hypothetical protein JKY10_07860 [Cohaesibacteraceae bacterium]|nr:hypothetical protein [Cohaesibacteraceae bacterium]